VKESCIQDLDNKFLLSLHSHEHYMAFILIYVYIWLCLENEEAIEVTEEKTPPPSESQAGNCFYFDICGSEPDSPTNEGKPRCMQPLPCVFK
jgi:ferric iron reductase protein FhuF